MLKNKKIAIIAIAVTMIVVTCATAVYAITGNPEAAQPASVEEPVIEPVEVQAVENGGQAKPNALDGRGLTEEQIDWIMYVMDNGRLPDLTDEQLDELRAAAGEYFARMFPDGGGEFFLENFDRVLAAFDADGRDFSGDLTAIAVRRT